MTRKWFVGKQIKVYYQPDNPAKSVIIQAPRWVSIVRLAIGIVLFSIALISWRCSQEKKLPADKSEMP